MNKAKIFKKTKAVFEEWFFIAEENYVGIDFIAPSLSYVPELTIKTLEELIESYRKEVKRVVLINPSVNPSETLKRAIGNAPNFYDNSYLFKD